MRVPWTARRSNQSILKEINPEYSLEGLMLKLKLQYFGHLMGREGTRASRRVEEGLSRSLSGGGGKPSFPSPYAGDLRELPGVPLRGALARDGVSREVPCSALKGETVPDSLPALDQHLISHGIII